MSKITERVKRMKPEKGFRNLILCGVLFVILAGIGTMAKFGSRVPEVKQQLQSLEQVDENNQRSQGNQDLQNGYEKEHRGDHEEDHEIEWKQVLSLNTSDYIFVGIVVGIGWILFGVYWLYTTAYVVCKSWEVGIKALPFAILTIFTNLFGVLCLWIYIKCHSLCIECGKLQPRKTNNCSLCGAAIYIKCPECGTRISVKDKYCNGCGRKMR